MEHILGETLGAFLGSGIAWAIFLTFLRGKFEARLDNLTDRVNRLERKCSP